jgi:short-chain 2-methylacyl-CoA dehydrogenase
MSNSFTLSAEHEDFRAVVADFAARDLAPHVERWNAAHEVPLEAVKLMGDLGLFGLGGPEEYGGAGDFTSLCIAIEEIGRVDQSLGITPRPPSASGSIPSPTSAFRSRKNAGCPI